MMRKEIGSEFWHGSTRLGGNGISELMPKGFDTRYVLSGRTALDIVVEDAISHFGISSAYLPEYCCHTMIEPFVAHGIKIGFYSVKFSSDGIVSNYDCDNSYDFVYLIDYFGFVNSETLLFATSQKKAGKIVAYDATHALFCEGLNYGGCDYVFGSFRKWLGVNAAFCSKAVSWTDFPRLLQNGRYVDMRNEAFVLKQRYMAGESIDKEGFLSIFSQAEDDLEHSYKHGEADARSLCVLESVDCTRIREVRRKNAQILIDGFSQCSGIALPYKKVNDGECPLFLPARIEREMRNDIRSHFICESIYLPIHWPLSDLHRDNDIDADIYYEELSLVCDQRYSCEDMQRMVNVKERFFR